MARSKGLKSISNESIQTFDASKFDNHYEMVLAVHIACRQVAGFSGYNFGSNNMRKLLILAATGLTITVANSSANAQVDLSAYADAEGYIDVQALTCAQLAGTWQDQADLLTTWYSGWYNGLAKKHYINIGRAKEMEHEVIVYCKANPQVKIIQAIDVMIKRYREERGITVAK
jgi:hypothetical protein